MKESYLRLQLAAALLILLAVILIYLPGLSGPFLFDDKPALTGNELVQIEGGVLDEWRVAAMSSGSGPLRRPLTMLTFAANHAVAGGFWPVSLKAVNLAIHIAVAVLLHFLCMSILAAPAMGVDPSRRRLVALMAATIWLLHPLNVSTVLYTVQRMAQLSTLFVVACLLLFTHYRQRWAQSGATTGDLLAAALWILLLTLGAVLSKENGALLPWLIVVLEVSIFCGMWAGRTNVRLAWMGWLALPLPVMLAVMLVAAAPESLIGGYVGREFTLEERLLTQGRLLWRYLGWLFIPNIRDMGFQHDDIALSTGLLTPWTTMIALCAWALVLVLALVFRKRFPLLLLAVLFFLVGHSMESTLLPLEMVYEHRNYLPGMLVCLLLAWFVVVPVANSSSVSAGYPVAGVLVVLGVLLFLRVQSWSDELLLAQDNLRNHPQSSRSNYFYANALLRHYRRGESRGLDDRERSEALLLSRHYFERMYQTNSRDVAALVMLYYLDSRYFTQMQEQVDWLAKLDQLLDTRTMQPSDWNALEMLFGLFAADVDRVDSSWVAALFDKMEERYPDSVNMLRYRYQYLSASGADRSELLALLQRGLERAPSDAWFSYKMIYEQSRVPDMAQMYQYARLWLLNDPSRYHLLQLKDLFDVPHTLAETNVD